MIFALCFCIVLLDGFDTAAIGYIAPSLITEWGVERPALAPVLSAALFGLAFGALSSGPLADRFGRKTVLVGSVLVIGVACLASAFSGSLTQLVVWRFITGLGLGAAMPNAVTLMSEYCPDGRRATLTNAMFCGFPLGAAFGGFLAAWMIPQFGLAQRPGARRDRAAGPDGAAAPAAAGVGALHGRRNQPVGAHPRRAAPHLRDGRRCDLLRHAREGAGAPRGKSGIGVVLSSSYAGGLGDAVGRLFHGPGDLLRADQLDADPVQGCRAGAAAPPRSSPPCSRSAASGRSSSAG